MKAFCHFLLLATSAAIGLGLAIAVIVSTDLSAVGNHRSMATAEPQGADKPGNSVQNADRLELRDPLAGSGASSPVAVTAAELAPSPVLGGAAGTSATDIGSTADRSPAAPLCAGLATATGTLSDSAKSVADPAVLDGKVHTVEFLEKADSP